MNSSRWDKRFLGLCEHISQWSKDPSTKVGAVITDGRKIVSIGFNGLPKQIPDDPDILNNREEKYKYIIHAEMNAILASDSASLRGCIMYTFPFLPCTNCSSMLIQSGIRRVVSFNCTDERWKSTLEQSKRFLEKSHIDVIEYPR